MHLERNRTIGRQTGYLAQRATAKAIEDLSNDGQPMTPAKALALAKLVSSLARIKVSLRKPWLRKARRRPTAQPKLKSRPQVASKPVSLGAPSKPCTVPLPSSEQTPDQTPEQSTSSKDQKEQA